MKAYTRKMSQFGCHATERTTNFTFTFTPPSAMSVKYFTSFPYFCILDLTLFNCGLYRLSQLQHGSVNSTAQTLRREPLMSMSDGNFILSIQVGIQYINAKNHKRPAIHSYTNVFNRKSIVL